MLGRFAWQGGTQSGLLNRDIHGAQSGYPWCSWGFLRASVDSSIFSFRMCVARNSQGFVVLFNAIESVHTGRKTPFPRQMLLVLEYGLPVLFTLFVWWFSTGFILYLDGLPQKTFRYSLFGAAVVLVLSLYGLFYTAHDTSILAAYIAFSCGLLVWGFVEITFLMGVLTGPRRSACPVHCTQWQRFGYAIAAILYHELTIIVCAVAIAVLTWQGDNQVGLWTFLALWIMRQSTKLNLFFGVRNLGESLLPPHLQYMKSFFVKKPMNLLFPISVTVSTVVATLMLQAIFASEAGSFEAVALTLVATLILLAILEHWFLVLPLPFEALWSWGLRSRDKQLVDESAPHNPDDDSDQGGGALRCVSAVSRSR